MDDARITIAAYRGEIKDLRALVDRVRGKPIQLARADRIYGADHLRHAAALATRAVDEGRARTTDLATETLVYAAGERQVHKALAFLGVSIVTREIAAIAWDAAALDTLAREMGWTRDDALLAGDEGALDAFGVTREERAMLPRERWGELILERVALVDVLKA
jgi:KEOPS complex subunit Cgi121